MRNENGVSLKIIKIGSYTSVLSICRDGYSLSSSPIPEIETSEVLARINECQPLISTDGSYQNEILKNVFNIGLKRAVAKPLWITPNSIRRGRYHSVEKGTRLPTFQSVSSHESTLHRQFAALLHKGDKEILSFVNRYGLLKPYPVHNLVFRKGDVGQQMQLGESLLWWREEINDLASCLKLWDMVSSSNKKLKDVVLWHRDGIALRLNEDYIHLVGRRNMNLLTRWHRGDLKGPALYYISLEMDKRLLNTMSPKMPDLHSNEVSFFPKSLLSAIWLMFLLEISGGTRLLQCCVCGEYFNSHDPRSQFCSARCRMRNYRSGQKSKQRRKVKKNLKT